MKKTSTTSAATPAVRVSLHGSRAQGRSMIIDRADWDHVSDTYGQHWAIVEMQGHKPYVYTARMAAVRAAGDTATGTTVSLARLIAKEMLGAAPPIVMYRNGNSLDLRRSNLTFDRSHIERAAIERDPVTVEPYDGD